MRHSHGNQGGTVPGVGMIVVLLLPMVVMVPVEEVVPVLLDQDMGHYLLLDHQDLLVHRTLTRDRRRMDLNSHNQEEILSRLLPPNRMQLQLNLVHHQDIQV